MEQCSEPELSPENSRALDLFNLTFIRARQFEGKPDDYPITFGGHYTPELTAVSGSGEPAYTLQLSYFFAPNSLYSPSVAAFKKPVKETTGAEAVRAFVKKSDFDETLTAYKAYPDRFERAGQAAAIAREYEALALLLSAKQADKLGFSRDFVEKLKTQSALRKLSNFCLKTLGLKRSAA